MLMYKTGGMQKELDKYSFYVLAHLEIWRKRKARNAQKNFEMRILDYLNQQQEPTHLFINVTLSLKQD